MLTELAQYGNGLAVPAVVILWLAALFRTRSVVHSKKQRGLWLAVVSAAAAMTLNLPVVMNFAAWDASFEHEVSLARNCIGVVSAGLVLYFVASITGRRRLQIVSILATGICPGILIALDVMAPSHGRHAFLSQGEMVPSPPYWVTLIIAHLLADSVCSFVCWRYGRKTGSKKLAASLLIFGAGTALAGIYWIVSLISMVLGRSWGSVFLPLLMNLHALLRASALFVPSFLSLLRAVQDGIVAWRLWPLWRDLVTAVPNVALSTPQGRFEELVRPAAPRTLLAYRKVIEIRDSILVLEGYFGYCEASKVLPGQPLDCDSRMVECEASILAHLIKEACQAKVYMQPELRNHINVGALGSGDLDEEKRFLLDVAHAYAKAPVSERASQL